jgi:predicted DNA binding CopG/RHH family protein
MKRKTTSIQLRVTPLEKKAIQKAAEKDGLPMSAWIRRALSSALVFALLVK